MLEIDANTIIGFHRLLIRKGRGGVYYVTRWGGRSQIATREGGISAIRALKSGQSVGVVEKTLAPQGKTISLHRLLEALSSADLIQTMNGLSVSRPAFHPFSFVKSLFRSYVLPHCLAAIRKCPLPMQRWARYAVASVGDWRSLRQRARTARENIRTTAIGAPKSFQTAYLHHLLWNIADTEAIFGARPSQARRWLDHHVQWTGLENIERAQSLHKGVVCAGFHFSATRLVASLLMSRGLDINLIATPSPTVNVAETISWHEKFCSIDPTAGRFRGITNVGLTSVKELLAALARNEGVLSFPDMHTINPNSDDETRRRCAFFGTVGAGFQPPTIEASIAGTNARMNEWAGWLAAQSRAPVLPVLLLRVTSRQYLMTIEAPIMSPEKGYLSDRADLINSELFRVLDRYVHAYPSQWFAWHRFHFQRVSP